MPRMGEFLGSVKTAFKVLYHRAYGAVIAIHSGFHTTLLFGAKKNRPRASCARALCSRRFRLNEAQRMWPPEKLRQNGSACLRRNWVLSRFMNSYVPDGLLVVFRGPSHRRRCRL